MAITGKKSGSRPIAHATTKPLHATTRHQVTTRHLLVAPVIALGLFVAWMLVLAIPGWLLSLLLLVAMVATTWALLAVVVTVATVLVVAVAVRLRTYGMSVRWSVVASAVVLGCLVACPSAYESAASRLSRWADFAYYRRDLNALVRRQHATGQRPALATITIGGLGSIAYGIAYDESGEIVLPRGRQSARWQAAAAGCELSGDAWGARRLYGNYFWWDAQ